MAMNQSGARPDAPVYKSAYMARMKERTVQRPRPHTSNTTPTHGNHYESSYLRKMHENPAPSISKSDSFRSGRGVQSNQREIQPTNTYESTSPYVAQHRMELSTSNSNQPQVSPINTNSTYQNHPQPRLPPSPAETMDAILMEEINRHSVSPQRTRGSFNYSPLARPKHQNPSPERMSSPPRNRLNPNVENYETKFDHSMSMHDESPSTLPKSRSHNRSFSPPRTRLNPNFEKFVTNFGNSMNMRDESPSPPPKSRSPNRLSSPPRTRLNPNVENFETKFDHSMSIMRDKSPSPLPKSTSHNRSRSVSPESRKPLSPSHQNNIQSYEYQPKIKLPHEQRYGSHVEQRTTDRGIAPYDAPFWTQVSVKVSAALLKAGKDGKIAEAAQIAVVQAGAELYETDQEALNYVSTKTTLAVMRAGGDANTAAIATVACIQANDETPETEAKFKSEVMRVMDDIRITASAVAQKTTDATTKAVDAISEFATRGLEDLQILSKEGYRNYRDYQKNYSMERQKTLRRLTESDGRRGHSRRRSSGRPTRRESRYDSDDSYDYHRRRRNESSRRDKDSVDSGSGSFSSSSFSSSTSTSSESSREVSSRQQNSKGKGKIRSGRYKKNLSASS